MINITKTCTVCGVEYDVPQNNANQSKRCRPCQARYNASQAGEKYRREHANKKKKSRYSVCHYVDFLPGYPKDDGDLNLLGRHLAYHEVRDAPTGFLPDGLLLEVRNGGRLTMTGVVINGKAVFTKVDCTPPESVV